MPDSPTPELDSTFVCECDERMRSACAGEPFYKEHEGKRYCVLHFPSREKRADFEAALLKKLEKENFNFCGAWFPSEVSFDKVEFSTAANFQFAIFSAKASFEHARFTASADFRDATFMSEGHFFSTSFGRYAYFTRTKFNGGVSFTGATFETRAFFNYATFGRRTHFTSALFKERAYFMQTTFCGKVYFHYTSFASYVIFSGGKKSVFGNQTSIDFQFSRFERPEAVSFHTVALRPHWFANLDTRKLTFINVDWPRGRSSVARELEELQRNGILSPRRLLAIIYAQLAVNAEDNQRYEEASNFRYMAMEVRRIQSFYGLAFWKLSWWYWVASGYGERVLQAFLVLLGIWFVAGLLYTRVGFAQWEPRVATEAEVSVTKRDDVGAPLKFSRALTYSAAVLTFQRPEPKPATTAAQTVVLLETILGPVQAALLALAIRRKFMR
jgi:hypothetical protein